MTFKFRDSYSHPGVRVCQLSAMTGGSKIIIIGLNVMGRARRPGRVSRAPGRPPAGGLPGKCRDSLSAGP